MINEYTNEDLFVRYYFTESTDPDAQIPANGVPGLLERCYALDEHIDVDIMLPGCPPHPDQINASLLAVLKNEKLDLPFRSVCDTCPAIRTGKGDVSRIKRFFTQPEYDPKKPLQKMRCILEQGYLCTGPVTKAGCSGINGDAPRCIKARVGCRGCYGPVKKDGNQKLDMLNALVSNGIDIKSLPERSSLLRFSGAHNRLACNKGGM